MAEDSVLLLLAGIAVAGIVGLIVGLALASAPPSGPAQSSFHAVQELETMRNHETISWRDRRGLHVIEIDRQVEMAGE